MVVRLVKREEESIEDDKIRCSAQLSGLGSVVGS